MLLTIADMVSLLRSSINIQMNVVDELEGTVIDPAYLAMTDEDITLYIKLGCSSAFPHITDLADLEDGSEYPIMLLAKVELYSKLATIKAEKVDLVADNNNQLKQSQRFDHYMKLVESAREDYRNWIEDNGMSSMTSFNVTLGSRHYSNRNYSLTPTPKVKLNLGTITNNSADVDWEVSNSSHFGKYLLYISTTPIIDMYREGAIAENKVNESATLIFNSYDVRNVYHRVEGLLPSTQYYIAVVSVERNQVFGYSEKTFTTLQPFA